MPWTRCGLTSRRARLSTDLNVSKRRGKKYYPCAQTNIISIAIQPSVLKHTTTCTVGMREHHRIKFAGMGDGRHDSSIKVAAQESVGAHIFPRVPFYTWACADKLSPSSSSAPSVYHLYLTGRVREPLIDCAKRYAPGIVVISIWSQQWTCSSNAACYREGGPCPVRWKCTQELCSSLRGQTPPY